MALNWEKKHPTSLDERRRGTRFPWDQLEHCREGCLLRRSSLEAATVCHPPLPPRLHSPFLRCFCPFLLPKEKQDRTRGDEGKRQDVVGSPGLSLGDGWFYPNAINSPTPRAHASRVKLTLVSRAPLATGIAMLPLNLARRCIPLLRVLELAERDHFVPRNRWQPRVAGSVRHSWIPGKNRVKRQRRYNENACLQGRDFS